MYAFHRAILAQVSEKGRASVSEDTRRTLECEGMVRAASHAVGDPLYREDLTPEGIEIGRIEAIKLAARRRRRNANARGRDAAMRSLGMVKTPYGWE